ncbi:HMG (high mobility group) box protein [Actinidia rufa]|uniref:HMG (High mobility group) box protein n=1 Tax=Actinidia rufa TaxID=165716 RepID=A0A7J0ELA9_9ERIC|nr:HMG (high mobility group) box protein [Actinidia rufa]
MMPMTPPPPPSRRHWRTLQEGELPESLKTQENQSGLEEGQTTEAITVFREQTDDLLKGQEQGKLQMDLKKLQKMKEFKVQTHHGGLLI